MGKFSEYKLSLKSLPEGTHEFEFQPGKKFFEDMESQDIHDANLHVTLTVEYKRDIYSLDFAISGTITLLCDRCLDDLVMPVETDYHINVKYGEDYNDEADDLLIIPEGDNYLNVAYMLYDTIALTIPIKHVHPAGQCNRQMSQMLKKHRAYLTDEEGDMEISTDEEEMTDINSQEEAQNIDPRWNALKGLAGIENND